MWCRLWCGLGGAVRWDPNWRVTPGVLEGMCRLLAQPGGAAVLGFRMWPCEPALVWAETPCKPSLAHGSLGTSAVPFYPSSSVQSHSVSHSPAWAGSRKQTLQSPEGAGPAPCKRSARNGEVEVIPQCSQEVPLKSPAAPPALLFRPRWLHPTADFPPSVSCLSLLAVSHINTARHLPGEGTPPA